MERNNSGFRRRAMILGTLAGVAAFIFATIAPASAQPVSSPPGLDWALAAKGANIDRLLAMKGVVGADGSAVIFVTTAERCVAGLPRRLDGVAVVIKVTGPTRPMPNPIAKSIPAIPGARMVAAAVKPSTRP